jgi:ribonuclease HI
MKSKAASSKKSKMPIVVFADGASSGNPGPGGWGAIIATPDGQVTELGHGDPETTNNRMELMGTIKALERLHDAKGPVEVYTDSVYVIRGITQWSWAWRKKDWKTGDGKDVANPDLWKKLIRLVAERGKENPIEWKFVRGHSGIPGNERCDEIAVAFSKGKRPSLYHGPLLKYPLAIHDIPDETGLPEMKPRKAKETPYSYLSEIGGTVMRHETWADCERRVKGRSGAKFKKAMTPEEEKAILKSWGHDKN